MADGLVSRAVKALSGSLRVRIFLPTAFLFAATLAGMAFAATYLHDRNTMKLRGERADLIAGIVAGGVTKLMLEGVPDRLPELLSAVGTHRSDVDSVSVVRPGGLVAFSSDPALIGSKPYEDLPETELRMTALDGTSALLLPMVNEAACGGCHGGQGKILGWLDLRFSGQPAEQQHLELLRILAIPAVIALAALLATAWILLGREAIRPLSRLLAAIRKAHSGDLSARADEGRPDELGEVARGFDQAMSELQSSRARLETLYRDRLYRADRFATLGELATGLAHEVKNPLAGISGALELLAEDLADFPRQGELVAEMRYQVGRLAKTMDAMLGYARPAPPVMGPTDVNLVVKKVIFLINQRSRRGARVETELSLADPMPSIIADASKLEQMLLNIALNACQAMGERGGKLLVRTSEAGEAVRIEVEDQGPGIPEEVRKHLFEPFFTTRKDGNGLGLAISARIVEEHGGQLDFQCPAKGGTIFSVELPRAGAGQEQAQ